MPVLNIDDPEELAPGDARDLQWIGRAPSVAPVVRARDVLLIPAGDADGDWRTHPPVEAPIDLGHSLTLTALPHAEAELILNACTPRGHYYFGVRQFSALYAFVLEVDLADYEEDHFGWDRDGVLMTALQLSRLVRDNGYSTEFAARLVDHADGAQQVIPQGLHYWLHMEALPQQLARAISLSEGVVHQATLERALVMLFMGLEALLNTGKHQVTKQLTTRLPLLATDVGLDGITKTFARKMYAARSAPAHGQELVLPQSSATAQATDPSAIDPAYLARLARIQDLLRAATRKGIGDPAFAANFVDTKATRARWPAETRVGFWRRTLAL